MIRMTSAQGDEFFRDEVRMFTNVLERLQLRVGNRMAPARDEAFHELVQAIRTMSRKCRLYQKQCDDQERLRAMKLHFQHCIAPWFETSWFMERAKRKPRGYPGDFELLTAIYDGTVRSPGMGGYLDLYFLNSDLGQAVVARMQAARDFLNREVRRRDGDLVILNVASGPCREFFTGFDMPQNNRRVTLYCIDNDADALQYVANQVTANGNGHLPQLEFVQYNALRMRSAKANIARFGQADIIYSIGLLDYIPDKHLVATMQGLRETLKPGGVAYLAFKDDTGYDACEYQWFVDWYFYQREEQDCWRLLTEAGFETDRIEVQRDQTGIIMNFMAPAAHGRTLRTDVSERSRSIPRLLSTSPLGVNGTPLGSPSTGVPNTSAGERTAEG